MAARRVFYGWWIALAFFLVVFRSTGIRPTLSPFLAAFACGLLLGATPSLGIDERPRWLPGLARVAGGRE